MSQPLVNVTIDGRTIQVPRGTNLVEAAKQAGIEIPVFCYHPKLDPAGVCRMCLVQIEKIPKPQAACTTLVGDGMVVATQNAVIDDLRKGVLEFLLINHPLDCPVCDKGGECDLQDLTFAHGPSASRLQDAKIHKDKSVDLGNFIVLDNERCILCRRCVRFDNEISTEGNLIIEERAHRNVVTTMEGQRYDSYFSGNTIEICPVGALTSELYRFKARPWDLSKVESICTGCSVGCNTRQEFRHGKLLRITARDNAEVDQGWLCDRGRFNYSYVQGEERLTEPLIRRNGKFEAATWAEALKFAADKFKAIKTEAGGRALGVIGGGKLTNEEAYLLQKLARVAFGTNNVDHRVSGQAVASLGAFAGRQADLSDASAIVIIDTDPAETAPVLDLRIRRMADRKLAKIAVVGSVMPTYRGRHARLQLKPGQTAAAVAAMAAMAAGKKASASAADSGAVAKLVELISAGRKVVIIWGGNDPATGKAVVELATALKKASTGSEPGRSVHVLIPGAQTNSRGAEAMGVLPGLLPGYANVADNRAREAAATAWNVRSLPAEPGLSTGEMLEASAAGQVKGLLLAGANLVGTYSDRKLAAGALQGSFVVAVDLFMTETAALADVVLPAAALSEKSGTYTNLDGLVQSVKAAKKAEGSAQPDADIIVGLAAAMGVKLSSSAPETAAEISRLFGKLADGVVLGGAAASLLPAVPTPDSAAQTPAAPAGALWLVPVDRLYAGGGTAAFDAGFAHVLPKPEARFHPTDAAAFGLADGESVDLTSGGESLRLTARLSKQVVAGTVQAIRGLTAAPVNLLTAGGAPVAVAVAKSALEVAH